MIGGFNTEKTSFDKVFNKVFNNLSLTEMLSISLNSSTNVIIITKVNWGGQCYVIRTLYIKVKYY